MKKSNPLHWEAFEYEPRERTNDWFWAVGIITVGIAVTAILYNNVLFGLVIILAGFTLSLYASRPPRIMDVIVEDEGIRVHDYFYPYRTLESFWIDEHSRFPKILIKSQRLLMPYINIPLGEGGIPPDQVKRNLIRHLPEVFHSESIFEKILERLGF